MNKKSQELPIKTIIVLILALIVFVILVLLFSGSASKMILKILGVVNDTVTTSGTFSKP